MLIIIGGKYIHTSVAYIKQSYTKERVYKLISSLELKFKLYRENNETEGGKEQAGADASNYPL